MKFLISVSLSLAAFAILPAFAQIRTPYNSYPPTPAERAQTAELNREAAECWDTGSYTSQDRYQQRPAFYAPTISAQRYPYQAYPNQQAYPGYPTEDYPRQAYSHAGYSPGDDDVPRNYPSRENGNPGDGDRYGYQPVQPRMDGGYYDRIYREGYRAGYSAASRGQ